MQGVDVCRALGKAARAVGRGAKWVEAGAADALGSVNPDVWRELTSVSALGFTLLMPKREAVTAKAEDGYLPLVLVHGLGGNRGTWTALRLFLRLNGRRRVYAFGYESGSVPEHAAGLVEFVARVREATGAAQVEVVAHSLGGIVARYAIQRLGMRKAVANFVTLASPHGGTFAAYYTNTALTTVLRPDSELLVDLNGDPREAYPERFTAIYSDQDVYVVPATNAKHPFAENVFVAATPHTRYLLSPAVFRIVAAALMPANGDIFAGFRTVQSASAEAPIV